MLEVRGLHAWYGKSHILQGVDLDVRSGEIVSLLGRNGVGRSTTVKSIMGQVVAKGAVRFLGEELVGRRPHEIARRGMGYVPEDRRRALRRRAADAHALANPDGRPEAGDGR